MRFFGGLASYEPGLFCVSSIQEPLECALEVGSCLAEHMRKGRLENKHFSSIPFLLTPTFCSLSILTLTSAPSTLKPET